MRAGGEEHLGRSREILRTAATPGATMDKDKDRRCVAFGAVNVEPLNLGLSVSDALGLADAKARQFAVADALLDQLLAVWRIGSLVISCVECRLVVVKVYRRPFLGHRTPAICACLGDWPRPKERER
jgi:hypothetical protein